MSIPAKVDTGVYWSLPGPRAFVQRIASAGRDRRCTLIRHTDFPVPGLWEHIEKGLKQAQVAKVYTLSVSDGMNVASAIGQLVGIEPMSAAKLAQIDLPAATAVFLRAHGDDGRTRCEAFVEDFLRSAKGAGGNVILFARAPVDAGASDGVGALVQQISFDGALESDEIMAYVATRTVATRGPGSTRLLRSLITEYSGFDAVLAEQLMRLNDDELLSLPDSLDRLTDFEAERWTAASWTSGTTTTIDGTLQRHPLHERSVAMHDGPRRAAMQGALSRRYWQACVTSLLPWLEQLRQLVLEVLDGALDEHAAARGGKLQKPVGRDGRMIDIEKKDLEVNNIVAMSFGENFNPSGTPAARAAIAFCHAAKPVRDDIAHLRKPSVDRIMKMIAAGDELRAVSRRARDD